MSSVTPPASGIPSNWFTNLESELALYWSDIVSSVKNLLSQLIQYLDLAQQDLPVLAELLASYANIITTAFPGAGALTAYIPEVEAIITDVEGYIQTTLGVIMSLLEAQQIGALVSKTPITGAQKMATVLKAVQAAYPSLPESVHRQTIELAVGKMKSKVK